MPLLVVLDPLEGEAGYRGLFKCQAVSKDEHQIPCPNVFEARIALVRNNNTSSCGCQRHRPVNSATSATEAQALAAVEIVAAAPPAEKYVPKKIAAKGDGLGRKRRRELAREVEAAAVQADVAKTSEAEPRDLHADLRPLLNGSRTSIRAAQMLDPEEESDSTNTAIENAATVFPYLSVEDRIEWWSSLGCDLNLLTVNIVSFQDRVDTATAARDAEQNRR